MRPSLTHSEEEEEEEEKGSTTAPPKELKTTESKTAHAVPDHLEKTDRAEQEKRDLELAQQLQVC